MSEYKHSFVSLGDDESDPTFGEAEGTSLILLSDYDEDSEGLVDMISSSKKARVIHISSMLAFIQKEGLMEKFIQESGGVFDVE